VRAVADYRARQAAALIPKIGRGRKRVKSTPLESSEPSGPVAGPAPPLSLDLASGAFVIAPPKRIRREVEEPEKALSDQTQLPLEWLPMKPGDWRRRPYTMNEFAVIDRYMLLLVLLEEHWSFSSAMCQLQAHD
jgi:hypothetical protein